jgi:hypothetical protein
VSDVNSASVSGGGAPPLTRRERREREEALARESAITLAEPTTESASISAPPSGVTSWAGESEPPSVLPMDLPSSIAPPSPPAPPTPPTPPEPPTQVGQPLTRRQLREMEQQQLAETGAVHLPTGQGEEQSELSITATLRPREHRAETPAVAHEPPPLPPVFAPPFSASTVSAPPVSGETGSFPIVPEGIPDTDTELAHSREVGSGSPMTHALILPTTPMMDIAGPIGDTGEILVTGQIPLPRLVTERGVHHHLEIDDDDSFDQLIQADSTPLTAPIRATRAVSTRDDERELQMVRRAPFGSTAALLGLSAVLLVTAAGGLVAVAVLSGLLAWPF